MLAALLNLEYQQLSQLCRSAGYIWKVGEVIKVCFCYRHCYIMLSFNCFVLLFGDSGTLCCFHKRKFKLESFYIYMDCNAGLLLLDSGIGLTIKPKASRNMWNLHKKSLIMLHS
jgi:hypothetical protein